MEKTNIGIFIFNEVEVLDFAGPFEVFSVTVKEGEKPFEVFTISEDGNEIAARNNLRVMPHYSFDNCPKMDLLIIPGGYGAEEIEIHKPVVLNWIKSQYKIVPTIASVCTGALLLAECEILDGKKATTHWMDIDRLQRDYPKVETIRNVKFIDEGNVLTSGGISAGINLSFHLVKRWFGATVAKDTAKQMEYDILIEN